MKVFHRLLLVVVSSLCCELLHVVTSRSASSSGERPEYKPLHIAQWSWVVSVMVDKMEVDVHQHHCAGSLIRPSWVLTASHCFDLIEDGMNPSRWTVRFSEDGFGPLTRLTAHLTTHSPPTVARVVQIIRHPHYSRERVVSDITLLRLDKPMTRLSGGHVVSLPKLPLHASKFPPGTRCQTVGWKCPTDTGSLCTAYRVELPIKGGPVCDFYHLKHGWGEKICVGEFDTGRGVCEGDSGGPLVCPDSLQNGTRVLAGTLSFVHKTRPLHHPAGYSDIASLLDWIHDTLQQHNDDHEWL